MTDQVRIGFSAAGSVASMSFANFLDGFGFVVVGHDSSNRVLINPFLNVAIISPTVGRPEYKCFLNDFLQNQCDLYIPFLDQELNICIQLIEAQPILAQKMLMCSELAIRVCNDKFSFKSWAQELEIKTVPLAANVPAFVKPREASGGKQSLIIRKQQILDALLAEPMFLEDYIVEEYIDGDLLSVDALWDGTSELINLFCRQRSNTSGVSSLSSSINSEPIRSLVSAQITKLGSSLGFHGVCSVQFMLRNSELYLLEVNPRMGGSAYHSHLLGSNIIISYFEMMLGKKFQQIKQFHPASLNKEIARFYSDILR